MAPELVVTGAKPIEQDAGRSVQAALQPEKPPAPLLKPVARKRADVATLSVRIPADLTKGLDAMAYFTDRQKQAFIPEMIEDGLNRWNPNWRNLLPDAG